MLKSQVHEKNVEKNEYSSIGNKAKNFGSTLTATAKINQDSQISGLGLNKDNNNNNQPSKKSS